jgi:hypothetical protein
MANGSTEYRFIFRGNAIPFGARVVAVGGKPAPRLLTSPPASSLAVVGGRSRGTSAGSSSDSAFKWGATLAESRGELAATGNYVTTVTSSIASAYAKNDPIIFEADLLRITIVSDHPKTGQPSIVPKEIVFGAEKGMFLNGKPIKVEYDNDLATYGTFAGFEKQYRTVESFFRKYQSRCKRLPTAKDPVFGERLPRITGGYVSTSIVRRIIYNGKTISGNMLALTGFGRIFFGEVLMNEYHRRLTVVRLAMGSFMEANVAYAEADTNGSWEP